MTKTEFQSLIKHWSEPNQQLPGIIKSVRPLDSKLADLFVDVQKAYTALESYCAYRTKEK